MADKHEVRMLDRSVLLSETISLASKRLDALFDESRREKLAKLLVQRRLKWRKRHKLVSQPGKSMIKHSLWKHTLTKTYFSKMNW